MFIPNFFFYSCYGHLLHHICNIAAFAGKKLRVEFGIFSQGGNSQFAMLLFKIKNNTSQSIFVITTKFFQLPLGVLFPTLNKKHAY